MTRPTKALRAYLAVLGRRGGKARLTKLTPAQRREIARTAALARWRRHRRQSSRSS